MALAGLLSLLLVLPLAGQCGGMGAIALVAPKPGEMTGTRRRNALLLFAVLQGLDFLTTLFVLAHGGEEANPVVRSLMPWTGVVTAILLSKAGLILVTWRIARRGWILYVGNGLYAAIVSWNALMMFLAVRL